MENIARQLIDPGAQSVFILKPFREQIVVQTSRLHQAAAAATPRTSKLI